ncbi:hypothetical protein M440DRAFT_1381694 [Trichoderma longibrachiatum ATCC 18648]|uniref:Cora-domain-containing protein n=1 Tax=Trichoderma longibrachiatum ATCC 18648 TaxID=983965 RepID=A0A2T4BWU2_TRILO|nr:hypothetical protein M440DRAFT_1381694 [Trichoderma longibrachiatum ATCC 18648]
MDSPPSVHRPQGDNWSLPRPSYFPSRNHSHESFGTPSTNPPSRQQSPTRNNGSEDELEIQYGQGPISAPRNPRGTRRVRQGSRNSNASSRKQSPFEEQSIPNHHANGRFELNEGLETDGRRAAELEEVGLSCTVALPSDNEQARPYATPAEANSVWRAEKTCDKRIGTTSLQSIHSIQYSISERGLPKVTLFCPQGPARHEEDASLVQARWLHVERSSMSIKILEKLVMDCPLINKDIQRVAILLLETIKETLLRHSEHGAYVEPGSAMRFIGQRQQEHDSHSIIVTDPVVFVAFPYVEMDSSRNHPGFSERDEYHPRTLLQNLYGFDVLTSRGKQQVIHKMSVCSQSSDTLYVKQLWCLLMGSDILITMSSRPTEKLLGETIEKRTDFFRQPLRIEIVDTYGSQFSMSVSLKTTWVDFFRHVMFTIYGNLTKIMDYDLVDEANEIVTADRWADIARSAKSGLLRFHLVERRITSRASSISSRKSSRTGIRKLLMDHAHRDKSRDSSRHYSESYDEDSSSSERFIALGKSSRRVWPGSTRHRASSFETPRFKQAAGKKNRRDGTESEQYPYEVIRGHGSQSAPTVFAPDGSDGKDPTEDGFSRHTAFTPAPQLLPLSSTRDDGDNHEIHPIPDDISFKHDHQLSEENAEETQALVRKTGAEQLEEGLSQTHEDHDRMTTEEGHTEAIPLSPIKNRSNQSRNAQDTCGDPPELGNKSTSRPAGSSSTYRRVTIEDDSETEPNDTNNDTNSDWDDDSWVYELIEVDFDDDEVMEDNKETGDRPRPHVRRGRANTPQKHYPYDIRRSYSYRRFHSKRSRSSSSSPDNSFPPRGRSRTQRRRIPRRDDTHSSREPSSGRGVRFDSQSLLQSNGRDSLELSPYGSSNATKVEASTVKAVAMPFFCWRQSGVADAASASEMTDQRVIKLLDHIDELVCDDLVGKYYVKVAEFTMDDVVLRHECLHEADSIGIGVNSPPALNAEEIGEQVTPENDNDAARNSTEASPSRGFQDITLSNQTKAVGLISHDKTLVKQLVDMSQQIVWSFIPPHTGGAVIHTLMKRFWGCVDLMCLQLLWEENEREQDAEHTYTIRNFSSQVKEYNSRRRKPSLGKIHFLECEDCKAAKAYPSAEEALKHLHEKHIDYSHSDSARPYDDPCYAWLHRIWHHGYPVRSSQDGLLGIVEDFVEQLSDIRMYVRELLNMTARDSSAADTPPLSISIIHIFKHIINVFVLRSKQLSLINRRRSTVAEDPQGNTQLVQRIDRKIDELLSLEIDANEHIIDLSESAKKDIFMSGIGSQFELPQAETVRVQFLALALMSGIQRPLLQPSYTGPSYARDMLLQLYRDYTSRLHFQANNRPRKRVFLDIHGLDEELQALDKLLGSQESCLYNALTLIDPLTSRYTTKTRLREFRAELQYGNNVLRGIIDRRREIENLATRLRILKDQVKQTIEIMEEDHGKAIRVFTVVTLFFLPLSFVSSFLGMNTVDVRDTEYSQRIFWITGVPVTVAVLSVAFVYGYKGEEILDWISHVLQDKRRRTPTLGENRDAGYRTSLEAGWRDLDPATEAKQHPAHRRRLTTLMRGRLSDLHDDIEQPKISDSDGKFWMERRNTDDSLAPIRRRM